MMEAEGMGARAAKTADGIGALRRFIYDLDAAIADGYRQSEPKMRVIFSPPPPPSHMDIPVWNEKTKTWYDAEY